LNKVKIDDFEEESSEFDKVILERKKLENQLEIERIFY